MQIRHELLGLDASQCAAVVPISEDLPGEYVLSAQRVLAELERLAATRPAFAAGNGAVAVLTCNCRSGVTSGSAVRID